jgi:hypothetical protein
MIFALIASLSIGLVGCGGAPSTGDMVRSEASKASDEAKKKMLDGYLKTMVKPKGRTKAR